MPWILGGIGIVVLLGFGAVVLLIIAVSNAEPDAPVPDPSVDPTGGPRLEVPTVAAPIASVSAKPTATAKPIITAPIVTARPTVTTPPTVPTPTAPIVLGAFPRARATNELDRVTAGLGTCKRAGDPTGTGSIRVDFEPDGRVGTLLARPFSGTPTGSCISSRFLAIKIGAFNGSTQQIQRTFTISGTSPGL